MITAIEDNTLNQNLSDDISDAQIFFYSSAYGMTAQLVDKLPFRGRQVKGSYRKDKSEPIISTEPFVLFAPTYRSEADKNYVPRCLKEFLVTQGNYKNMRGVVGIGNINFGSDYNKAADVIKERFDVPILGKVELSGTPEDIEQLTINISAALLK